MIDKLNEMIKKYIQLSHNYNCNIKYISLSETLFNILSDLEELKKLAEEDQPRMEDYWKFKKLRPEGHSTGCATDMVLLNAKCRCDVNKDNI